MKRLRLNIFAGVWLLLCSMIISISTISTISSIRERRSEGLDFSSTVARSLASNLEKFLLWDDRPAIKNLFDAALVEAHSNYIFLEYRGKAYIHTFEEGVPQALLTGKQGSKKARLVIEFLDEHSSPYYDVSVPLLSGEARLHFGISRTDIDRETLRGLVPLFFATFMALLIGGGLAFLITFFSTREISRLADAIRDSENRTRSLLETVPLGICELDSEGRILTTNSTCLKILKSSENSLEGRWGLGFFASERYQKKISREFKRILKKRPQPRPLYAKLRRDDGSIIDAQIDWSYSIGEKKSDPGIVCALSDITVRRKNRKERRAIEERFRKTERMESLGVLAGGIAHDFNNLLGSIIGNAELMLEDLSADSTLRVKAASISSVSRRAAELCHQMLAYAGKARITIRPIDISRLVRETGLLLKAALKKKVAFEFSLEKNLPAIRGDSTQIKQVVMNLVTNAADAIEDGGTIKVRTGSMVCDIAFLNDCYLNEDLPAGLYVFIEVEDNGCGMDAATMKTIFDPFFTTKFVGRGLGLSGVLACMHSAHGDLMIESTVGKGSSFRLFFPAVLEPSVPEKIPVSESPWRGEGKVLIVDDEKEIRDVARDVFVRMGFSVVDCASGREAIARFREEPASFVLVLLDLSMPHMSGEEVLVELRNIRSDVVAIYSSGYDKNDTMGRLNEKGPNGFIPKPFELAEFRREVRRVFSERVS